VIWAAPAEAASTITLATLVVDLPELDAAPRGSGVLVAAGTAGVSARALTHATAKWPWLAERAGPGRHVLRLSYNGAEQPHPETVRSDAASLLGVDVPAASVDDVAFVQWSRSAPRSERIDGYAYVGEATSGTGLANVIAQATSTAERLLEQLDDEPVD